MGTKSNITYPVILGHGTSWKTLWAAEAARLTEVYLYIYQTGVSISLDVIENHESQEILIITLFSLENWSNPCHLP